MSFDGPDHAQVLAGDERMGLPFVFGPACAADAVGVGLGRVRDVEIDHVGHLGDVDAPGGDIRGHEHPEGAATEAVHGDLALALGQVALEAGGLVSLAAQHLGQVLGPVLGAGEHDDRVPGALAEQVQEQGHLAGGGDRIDGVLHGGGRSQMADAHGDRIGQGFPGQAGDGRGHGGGKEQGLARGRQGAEDALDVGQKAHVEHVVGFVQDQGFQLVEADVALAHVVEQPAWAGHDHVHALAQGPGLGEQAHAAVDDREAQARAPAEVQGGPVDLFGQFAGRGQNQGAHGARAARVGHEPMQDGQQKGGRLAGAGLGQTHEVVAGGHVGDGFGLDGGGGFIAQALDIGEQNGIKTKRSEAQKDILWQK